MNKEKIKQHAKTVRGWGQKRRINWTIKLLVLGLLGIALYNQIFGKENLEEIWLAFLNQLSGQNADLLILALFLMPLNWTLETIKWKRLMNPIEKITWLRAFEGIFAGVTLSLFTPNRIGEYGGRILAVLPENNVKTVVATLVGSFSQLTVLLVMGMLGLSSFIYIHNITDVLVQYGVAFFSLLFAILMSFFYLNVDLVIPVVRRIPYIRRFVKQIKILKKYNMNELLIVLGLSFGRYSVYSIQYYIILSFFGIDLPLWQGLSATALIFLIQTSIPLPPITGLLVRGEVALYVWGFFSVNEISVLASTFGLWIINVILPALFGMAFILNVNVIKSLGYGGQEKEQENK